MADSSPQHPSSNGESSSSESSSTTLELSKRWPTITLVVIVLLLPVVASWIHRSWTIPGVVTIAGGPEKGEYRRIANALAAELERELGIEVRVLETTGSYENLRLLESRNADLAVVQSNVAFDSPEEGAEQLAFVTNLYSEVVHVIVRRDAGIATPDDLRDRSVSIGKSDSGDRSTANLLLDHFGLSRDEIDAREYDYAEVARGFRDDTLDVAIVTAGSRAPILHELLNHGVDLGGGEHEVRCDVIDVPFAEALSSRELAVSPHVLPAGLYRSRTPHEPPHDVQTVAVRSQLVCRSGLPERLVSRVARIVSGNEFLKRNGLSELYRGGVEFAGAKPSFEWHPGAEQVFDPAMRPLLDPDFVEATEGIRSFAVSLLIGLFLLYRWLRERRLRREEHRLDRYIRKLLDIERRQLTLDERGTDDLHRLQTLLAELTRLRQDALQDFSAHELREDRATDCFLEMCHALSDKINAKITRQRFEQSIASLGERLGSGEPTDTSDLVAPPRTDG